MTTALPLFLLLLLLECADVTLVLVPVCLYYRHSAAAAAAAESPTDDVINPMNLGQRCCVSARSLIINPSISGVWLNVRLPSSRGFTAS